MIKGMTGFGSAQFAWKNGKLVVEAKSLNHRYLDVVFYLPSGFASLENKIQQLAQKYIERGRVTISIKITQKPSQDIFLNKDAVKKYLRYTNDLAREFHLKNDLRLSDVVKLPGVVEAKESVLAPEAVWPVLEKNLRQAFQGLEDMRRREGRSLAADVSDKLKRMSAQIKKIKLRSKALLQAKGKEMTIDEFAAFQKGCDVNEEMSRLEHYIQEARALLSDGMSAGKKIDFIAQEMQRETNTIGSKLQDQIVMGAVVALKSKIEKVREQAQNIE